MKFKKPNYDGFISKVAQFRKKMGLGPVEIVEQTKSNQTKAKKSKQKGKLVVSEEGELHDQTELLQMNLDLVKKQSNRIKKLKQKLKANQTVINQLKSEKKGFSIKRRDENNSSVEETFSSDSPMYHINKEAARQYDERQAKANAHV
jgi:hypothetical protein